VTELWKTLNVPKQRIYFQVFILLLWLALQKKFMICPLVNKNILHKRHYVPTTCFTCICGYKKTQNFVIRGICANCTIPLNCIAYFLCFHSLQSVTSSFPILSIIVHCFLWFRPIGILQKA